MNNGQHNSCEPAPAIYIFFLSCIGPNPKACEAKSRIPKVSKSIPCKSEIIVNPSRYFFNILNPYDSLLIVDRASFSRFGIFLLTQFPPNSSRFNFFLLFGIFTHHRLHQLIISLTRFLPPLDSFSPLNYLIEAQLF